MLDEIVKMTLRFKATLLETFLNFQTARLV